MERNFHEVLVRIPDAFYYDLAGKLFSIFGPSIYDLENGKTKIDFFAGSFGWNMAIRKSCQDMDLQWLKDFYINLEWYDSDLFDSEIADQIERRVLCDDYYANNPYYKFLLEEGL